MGRRKVESKSELLGDTTFGFLSTHPHKLAVAKRELFRVFFTL